jgi:hypothetical protein
VPPLRTVPQWRCDQGLPAWQRYESEAEFHVRAHRRGAGKLKWLRFIWRQELPGNLCIKKCWHSIVDFPRLLRIIGARSSAIEPPSQSDRANIQLLPFRLTDTRAWVNLFTRPESCWGERKYDEHKASRAHCTDNGNLPEVQGRDDDNRNHADLARPQPRGCHLPMQTVPFGNEEHVQKTLGGVATYSLRSRVSNRSTISLISKAVRRFSLAAEPRPKPDEYRS